ncbi:hypothetical protein M8J76_006893 [Diaphorina citri]|nr:hypothetical protein M8J76_006893 [Diaphorina citri]
MKQNAMTQHEECERLTTSLNINTSSHQHESNDFDSETNFERNYESDDDRNDGFQKEPYDMCQVAISTTEDKASLHPGSANTDHTLQRRSSQSEDILQDVFGTSHQNNRFNSGQLKSDEKIQQSEIASNLQPPSPSLQRKNSKGKISHFPSLEHY